jgi:hypothetical protein
LVAIAERHMLQEWHDVITALLFHPDLPATLTDIVVEFGCARYQDLADRFLPMDQPVARADFTQGNRLQLDLAPLAGLTIERTPARRRPPGPP